MVERSGSPIGKAARYRAAFFCLLALAALAQESPQELYRSGMRLLAAHKADDALAAFESAVKARPNYAEAWAAIGVVHASRREYAEAEEPFRRACSLNAALPDACLYYGRILYLEDRFAEALPVLRNAAERDPKNGEIYRIEALCFEALGRSKEAEEQFKRTLALGRGRSNEDPAIDYGVFLYRAGRTEDALVPLRSAVERDPNSARAELEFGCALLELGRATEAAAHLERAAALDPASERARLLLGKARAQRDAGK